MTDRSENTPGTAPPGRVTRLHPDPAAAPPPRLAQVEAYWTALCRDGRLPARARIDPRGIEAALEHAFIAERIAPGAMRLRVGGTHLSDLLGMEVRGMPFSALFLPAARQALSALVAALFDRPALCRLRLHGPAGTGQPALQAHALLLPLHGEGGAVNRALGCLIGEGPIGRRPRRFAITGHEILPAPPEMRPPAAPVPGLAAPVVPFRPAPAGRPRLRLVQTDPAK